MHMSPPLVATITYDTLLPAPGAPADPAQVRVRLHAPDGTVIDDHWPAGGVVRDSPGRFMWTTPNIDQAGTWTIVAQADGFPEQSRTVRVDPSRY